MITVIAISGCQGSGKSTLADNLQLNLSPVKRTKFAKVIYEMHDSVLEILGKYFPAPKLDKRLLQLLGTEWGRNHIDDAIWVKCLQAQVEQFEKDGAKFVLVDDLRFKNEFSALKGIKIRLECSEEVRKSRCSQWRDITNHPSEIDLDEWVDKFDLVINTDTLSEEETLKIAYNFIISQQQG